VTTLRSKHSAMFSSTADAEAARKFHRRCQELFGDGCTVIVRKTTDAASTSLVQRGRLTTPSTDVA
jgi:hypothetical protein